MDVDETNDLNSDDMLRWLSSLIAPSLGLSTQLKQKAEAVALSPEEKEIVVWRVTMAEAKAATSGFNKRRASEVTKTLPLKVRRLNPVNTTAYVQILGTGMDTLDTSPSVLLFFDQQRFIFNVGEGLQRYCTEHKIKLSKIDHIFLSRVCSESTGGLPGLLLTLAGIGEEGRSVNLWGPSDLKYLVDAMRSFVPQAAMLHTRSFGSASSCNDSTSLNSTKTVDPIVLVDDEVVKISAIMLRPYVSENLHVLNEGSSKQNSSEMVKGESHIPNKEVGSAVKSSDMSVIYLCELPAIKGKFDPAKAVALGLKAGPKYRELQLGNSVKSDHKDIMVHPDDVMGSSIPGPIILIIDCPTELHLQDLLSIKCLDSYYADLNNQVDTPKTVTCVIHLTPVSITCTLIYQDWMKSFGAAQHIMAGHELKNVEVPILKSSARIATRLNYLCPQYFPVPGFCSFQHLNDSAPISAAQSEAPLSKVCESIPAENLLKFMLRPYSQLGLDRCNIPPVASRKEIVDELLLEIPEIVDAAKHVNQFWLGAGETQGITASDDSINLVEESRFEENLIPSCLENIRRDDLEIVLLGTGSSQPSKYRNVSSIYVNLFSKGSLLLDCGEGTLGQLKRRYGVHGADDAVRNLRCIWISHIHADHHTGLVRILAQRRDLMKDVPHEPIIVVGPHQLKRFLNAYQRLEDLDMQFLDCFQTSEVSSQACNLLDDSIQKRLQRVLGEVGLKALISVPVQHCQNAYGVILEATERVNNVGKLIPGWKIAYSGDTIPCTEMMKASLDATILIHEATFEDAMEEEAAGKRHSTTSQAIEVGLSADAYRIILTHFSQRYPKIPVIDSMHMGKTCIAFDLMSVNIADLHALPKILPYVKLLFRDEMINDEPEDADAQNVITS